MWCKEHNNAKRGTLRTCVLVATTFVTLMSLASADAFAQGAKPAKDKPAAAAPAAAPAPAAGAAPAGAPGAPAGDQTPWVKICGKVPQIVPPKEGEKPDPAKPEEKKELNICLTQQEIFDGRTGTVLVSAAIRKTDGQEKEQLEVLVPTGLAMLPFGAQGKIDESEPFKLQFIFCHQLGCIAEAEAPKTLVDQMKNGKQLVIVIASPERKGIAFPVPLNGFGKTYDGPPVDNAKYNEDRKKLAAEIEERRKQFVQKLKEESDKKKAEGGDKKPEGSEKKPK
jgi:invasion protein IalB